MRFSSIFVLAVVPTAAFSIQPSPLAVRPTPSTTRSAAIMAEGSNPASGKNIGPILRVGFLGLVAVQSVFGMSIELPGLFGDNPDFFGAAIDTAFFGYSARLPVSACKRRRRPKRPRASAALNA